MTLDRPAPGYLWTTTEVAALRETYPAGGVKAAQEALRRPVGAIHAKARTLGLRAPKLGTTGLRFARKYPAHERIDQAIRDGYASATQRGDIQRLADSLGRPKWWVQKRAAALCLTRTTRLHVRPWSREELEVLHAYAACDLKVIAQKLRGAGFERTPTACAIQLKRRRIDRMDPDTWSAPDLAELLGVHARTVADWIDRRGLRATKRERGPHGVWMLKRRDVRAWIKSNPRYVDLRRVDQTWFMDLVLGGGA
ncbi:MAG: helix-turn-helix domain-containing protein [Ideonella sp.]|nr:helix-turn-helix domain-containing protein [Ideonella sp.]